MKKNILILFVAIMAYGCASVYSPAGSWEYMVTGTPNGDVPGTMVLEEVEGVYSGKFVSDMGDMTLENLVYSQEEGLSATFYYQGMEFALKGTFMENADTGTVDGGPQIGTWPMTATRVEEKK
jgi:hypothetical protein